MAFSLESSPRIKAEMKDSFDAVGFNAVDAIRGSVAAAASSELSVLDGAPGAAVMQTHPDNTTVAHGVSSCPGVSPPTTAATVISTAAIASGSCAAQGSIASFPKAAVTQRALPRMKYPCPVCHKVFNTSQERSDHETTHSSSHAPSPATVGSKSAATSSQPSAAVTAAEPPRASVVSPTVPQNIQLPAGDVQPQKQLLRQQQQQQQQLKQYQHGQKPQQPQQQQQQQQGQASGLSIPASSPIAEQMLPMTGLMPFHQHVASHTTMSGGHGNTSLLSAVSNTLLPGQAQAMSMEAICMLCGQSYQSLNPTGRHCPVCLASLNGSAPSSVIADNQSEWHSPAAATSFTCSECSLAFADALTCRTHLVSHFPGVASSIANANHLVVCTQCSLVFLTEEDKLEHRQKTHGSFLCSECRLAFPDALTCRTHLVGHYPGLASCISRTGQTVVCAPCSLVFLTEEDKVEHGQQFHAASGHGVGAGVGAGESVVSTFGTSGYSRGAAAVGGRGAASSMSAVQVGQVSGSRTQLSSLSDAQRHGAEAALQRVLSLSPVAAPPPHIAPPYVQGLSDPFSSTNDRQSTAVTAAAATSLATVNNGSTSSNVQQQRQQQQPPTLRSIQHHCQHCPAKFPSLPELSKHQMHCRSRSQSTAPSTEKTDSDMATCKLCHRLYLTSNALALHMQAAHPNVECVVASSSPAVPVSAGDSTSSAHLTPPATGHDRSTTNSDAGSGRSPVVTEARQSGQVAESVPFSASHPPAGSDARIPAGSTSATAQTSSSPPVADLVLTSSSSSTSIGIPASESPPASHTSSRSSAASPPGSSVHLTDHSPPEYIVGEEVINCETPESTGSTADDSELTEVSSTPPEESGAGVRCSPPVHAHSVPPAPPAPPAAAAGDNMTGSPVASSSSSSRKTIPCPECNKMFATTYRMREHCITHELSRAQRTMAENGIFPCAVCKRTFTSLELLGTHHEVHIDQLEKNAVTNALVCEVCHKEFPSKFGMMRHYLVHAGIRPYECSVCKKRYREERTLNQHMVLHTAGKLFKCSECDKKYASAYSLAQHKAVHTGRVIKRHMCQFCEKPFRTPSDLARHELTHTKVRPHKCTICNLSFIKKNQLMLHEMSVHMITGETNAIAAAQASSHSGIDTPTVDMDVSSGSLNASYDCLDAGHSTADTGVKGALAGGYSSSSGRAAACDKASNNGGSP
eukprot:scpid43178/ scgid30897/ Zinc finger and SCAN domain-containing protein 10; Zinc finger protein 206